MITSKGYAAHKKDEALKPFSFKRRDLGEKDILIDIKFCGVCHSDIHTARSEWGPAKYPVVPGHEIVGIIKEVGKAVIKFKIGDTVGVGCIVDSCMSCSECKNSLEQYCQKGPVWTYDSPEKQTGGVTYGGYSSNIVVDEQFVLKISPKADLAATAPLLCAGITTYSPLKHWKVGPDMKVGIVGLGGLGHMGLKFAHAFGAHVVLLTTSPNKKADALRLGAKEVVLYKDKAELTKHLASFDFILDTVSAKHDIDFLLRLLKLDGSLVMVGLPDSPLSVSAFSLVLGRKRLSGSGIGGIKETQEMLDYCLKNNIVCDVEIIPIQKINEAYDRILKSDIKYRFVIDMSSLGRN